jgi:hypothetical protein
MLYISVNMWSRMNIIFYDITKYSSFIGENTAIDQIKCALDEKKEQEAA